MSNLQTETALRESLTRFETCLQTPVVSGDLTQWLNDARAACEEVCRLVPEESDTIHAEMLRKMAQQDLELASRVEQLSQQETELKEESERLRGQLDQLVSHARMVEPDEAKLDKPVSDFIQAGLAFILAVRKQETALTTWYLEAFNRDRGVGD